ncbi:MAG: MFS transporter [Cyanobacteria bacterium P01_H01_bin.74]
MPSATQTLSPKTTFQENSNTLKRLSWAQLFNLSVGVIGIQFAWMMQISLSSRILEPLGANPFLFGLIWCAGPITGLLVQPLVGVLSDKTWTPIGRRRPFILIGALLGALAIFAFPFSPTLLIAAILTWIIDACVNTVQGPYRALVPDIAPPEQNTLANSILSFSFGAGSVISMALPIGLKFFDITMTVEQQYIFAAAALVFTIGYSSLLIREVKPSPAKNKNSSASSGGLKAAFSRFLKSSPEIHKLSAVQFMTWLGLMSLNIYLTPFIVHHVYGVPDMSTQAYKTLEYKADKLTPLITQRNAAGDEKIKAVALNYNVLKEKSPDFDTLEKTLNVALRSFNLPLATVSQLNFDEKEAILLSGELVSSVAKKAMVPLTELVESNQPLVLQIAHLKAMKAREDMAVDTTQRGFLVYNIITLILSIPIAGLCNLIGKKKTYSFTLLAFSLAMVSAPFIATPNQVLMLMAIAGVGGAAILSLPFAMLADYLPDGDNGAVLGIFNIFICAPQLISALGIGKIIELSPMATPFGITHQWSIAFVVGGISVFIAMLILQAFKEKQAQVVSAA